MWTQRLRRPCPACQVPVISLNKKCPAWRKLVLLESSTDPTNLYFTHLSILRWVHMACKSSGTHKGKAYLSKENSNIAIRIRQTCAERSHAQFIAKTSDQFSLTCNWFTFDFSSWGFVCFLCVTKLLVQHIWKHTSFYNSAKTSEVALNLVCKITLRTLCLGIQKNTDMSILV